MSVKAIISRSGEEFKPVYKDFFSDLTLLSDYDGDGLYLCEAEGKLTLAYIDGRTKMFYAVDFAQGRLAFRNKGSGKEQLLQVLGSVRQEQRICDLTMGFAEDSLILSRSGAQIIALEKNRYVYALVQDALERKPIHNLKAVHCEAQSYLQSSSDRFDFIFMDPMFHFESTKSKVKKELQFLRLLEQPDANNDVDLLNIALDRVNDKVIVKRSPNAPEIQKKYLAYNVKGNSVRYDIYRK